jgi:hypothetical protein
MMRWTGGIATGVAVLFLGPALLGPSRSGLAATRREDPQSKRLAIAEIDEIAASLRQGSREAALRLVAATEDPLLDTGGRDARLVHLRDEVDELQRRLDSAYARHPRPPLAAGTAAAPDATARSGTQLSLRDPKPRLADAETPRAADRALPSSSARHAADTRAPGRGSGEPDVPGYSADPLRQAITCIRANQFARGLTLLDRLPASAASEYWRGKAHASLGRDDLALEHYSKAVSLAPKTLEGRLAKTDAEYLSWKVGLAKQNNESQPAPAATEKPHAKAESHPR